MEQLVNLDKINILLQLNDDLNFLPSKGWYIFLKI